MVKKIIPEKSKTEKNSKTAPENNLAKLIKDLKKCDNMKYSPEKNELLQKIRNKIIAIGTPAVLPMIKILEDQEDPSWESAAYIAGELHDERAIMPLINAIENHDLKITANEQLIKFGPDVVPEVIKRVENRIANPIKEGIGASNMTGSALLTIGEIHCGESIEFLNTLLDEYMSEMPDESFDPGKRDWKYVNVDFFHILEAMVRQQDPSSIPHIRKARDFFPDIYVDYKICQIAMGRIKKGHTDGFLPLEYLDIAMPSGAIMNMLSGGEIGYEDTFEENYGEYFEDDEDDDDNEKEIKKKIRKKSKSKSVKAKRKKEGDQLANAVI
jgi:hypothetical protein